MAKVELLGFYGSDTVIAQSAWTSTSRELTDDKIARIPQLIKYLAENGHHTPFEKTTFHFLVRCDLGSHIHLLKHRIGVSINAESARYKEIQDTHDVHVPEDWPDEWKSKLMEHTEKGNALYHEAVQELTPVLGRQRAKESGRYFRGYNSLLTCDIMFNFRSFLHFYKLRSDPHAQKEIRGISNKMLELIREIPGNPFKSTLEAFGLSKE